MSKKRSKWVSLVLIGLLIILAGCQAVGGVDLNKALTNNLLIKSSEGTQTVTLEIVRDSSVPLDEENQLIYDLFANAKLHFTDVKMQDMQTASMKGTLEYGKESIPFAIVSNAEGTIIDIEGAKQPIFFSNYPTDSTELEGIDPAVYEKLQAQIQGMTEQLIASMPTMSDFIIGNAPNPEKISVQSVTEEINGEQLRLNKVSAEIGAEELIGLAKQFIENILADDEGMKEFIGALYDVMQPLMLTMMESDEAMLDSPELDQILPFLENKTLAVEFIHTFLKQSLEQLLADYETAVEGMLTAEDSASSFFNNDNKLKVDLYIDSNLNIVKQYMEIIVVAPEDETEGTISVKVTSDSEVWNINKPVTADTIDLSGGFLNMNDMTSFNASKFVASLDPNSKLYDLLENQLNITKKEVFVFVESPDAEEDFFLYGISAYNDAGTVMVPVRFVSEELDGEVKWNGELRQVTIVDPLSGAVLVLTIDSDQAILNGQPVKLLKPAVIKEGSTYVPVRFVSEAFGAEVEWDQELEAVNIVRD